jgi:hypothetical protein
MFTLKTLILTLVCIVTAVVVLFLTLRFMGIDPRDVLPDDDRKEPVKAIPEHQVENEPACTLLNNRQISEKKPAE